jgi:hypothetical protein
VATKPSKPSVEPDPGERGGVVVCDEQRGAGGVDVDRMRRAADPDRAGWLQARLVDHDHGRLGWVDAVQPGAHRVMDQPVEAIRVERRGSDVANTERSPGEQILRAQVVELRGFWAVIPERAVARGQGHGVGGMRQRRHRAHQRSVEHVVAADRECAGEILGKDRLAGEAARHGQRAGVELVIGVVGVLAARG